MKAVESQLTYCTKGQSQEHCFFQVPKTNFPAGIPAHFVQWEVTIEKLREAFDVQDDGTDWSQHHILDCGCQQYRHELGLFVAILRCELRTGRHTTVADADLDDAEGPGGHGAAFRDGSAAAAATEDGPAPAPPDFQHLADEGPVADEAPPKKARRLAPQLSDPSNGDADEDHTLVTLMEACAEAAREGRMFSADPNDATTVESLARNVAQSLSGERPGDQRAKTEFPLYLSRILMRNPCYAVLCKFESVFRHMLGDEIELYPPEVKALCRLAVHPLASAEGVPLDGIEWKYRRRLFIGALYKDFIRQRVAALLQAAQGALEGALRNQLLCQARDCADSMPDISAEVKELSG